MKQLLVRVTLLPACVLALATNTFAAAGSDQVERVQKSTEVLHALTGADDNAIPEYILDRAEAMLVIPSFMKGGFVIGAEHGKGILSVRDRASNTWSPPAFVTLTGGTFGAQIGLQSVDLVLVVVNRDGINALLSDKFTFGGDLSVAAGPVGRSAKAGTDAKLSAQILAYSRAKGLFAGATLNGTALQGDLDSNERFYGKRLEPRAVVLDHKLTPAEIPPVANQWRDTLKQLTGSARQSQ